MTRLQIIFLIVAMCYLMIKGLILFVFYLASLNVEKNALHKQRLLRKLLSQKRVEDLTRHQKAYAWYQSQKERAHMEAL